MQYDKKVLEGIKDLLTKNKFTVSVAESVTGGHLQAAFTSVTDASKFFQGGITAYNAGQKTRHLDIEPIAGLENDCVTEQVSREMAIKVNKLFISDYGIAITGYASPVPEKGIDKLFAFFAIAHKEKILLSKKITTNKKGPEAQIDYANQVIKKLDEVLRKKR